MALRPAIAFAAVLAVLSCLASPAWADDEPAGDTQRFAMNPYHANIGRVTSIEKDGTMKLADLSNPRFALGRFGNLPDLSEGWYVGLVGSEFTISTEDTRLVRVRVESIGDDRSAVVRTSPKAAERIEKGEQIVLFRPPGASTKLVESCPDFVQVDDGRETTVLGRNSVNTAAALTNSKNHLKQLAIAIHNFHDVHNAMPPAVIRGPDGKPWHSWRVLILPYLEESALYNEYRWDEPWDGPNNSKLLDRMPAVYADPVHGASNPNHYAHYAAVTGPNAAFTTMGIALDANAKDRPLQNLRGRGSLGFRDFTDGLSNTIMFGSVGPEAKIPWMKPEDVVFEDSFPRPGEKGSFAAPYTSGGRSAGVFARCDGSVLTINDDVDEDDWRRVVLRNDGEPTSTDFDGLRSPTRRRGTKAMQFVEVYRDGETVKARLVAE